MRAFAEVAPLVLINRDLAGLPRILIDASDGIAQAMEHLPRLGHRRIAYLGGPELSWSNEQRSATVQQGARQHGAEMILLPAGEASFDAGRAMAGAILRSPTTAAIAFDDTLAQSILTGLADCGRVVPRDFSLVGCDDVLGAVTYPALTSISSRAAEAGQAAMRLLLARLADPAGTEVPQVLTTELVLRQTIAKPMGSTRPCLTPRWRQRCAVQH